jgi:FtsP/CotA-like multicopper oxidase with cupredoxin domain
MDATSPAQRCRCVQTCLTVTSACTILKLVAHSRTLLPPHISDSRLYALQLVAECPGADAETVEMILIGRDQGFLNTSKVIPGGLVPRGLTDPTVPPGLKSLEAAFINQYLLLPNGGRADVLVDFSIFADTCEFKMINNASNGPMSIDEPLMLQPTAEELATVGQVMAFRFAQSADAAAKVRADGKVKYAKKQLRADKFSMPAEFRRPDYFRDEVYGISSMNLVDIPQPQPANNPKSRALFLSEFDEFVPALGETRLKPSLGAFINGKLYPALSWCADDLVRAGEDPLSERPVLGTSEEWAIYNISPDMHPVHLHLVAFEVHRRCPLALPTDTELQACWDGVSEDPETEAESLALEAATLCDAQVRATAAIQTDLNSPQCLVAVDEGEDGPLDIAMSWNGYATVIRTSFDKEGSYVWHCHILSHEDNEMMRPLCVTKPGAANGYDSCQDYYSACGYDTTGLRTNGSAPVPAILELGAR